MNRVCAAYYNKAYALLAPIGLRQLGEYVKAQQALREEEFSKLKALTLPPVNRDAYERYLSNLGALDRLHGLAAAQLIGRHDIDPEMLSREIAALEAKLNAQARALGLAECTKNPYTAIHYANS